MVSTRSAPVDLVELLEPLLALQQQHFQAGREARRLVLPVGHQAGRRDHQRRAGQAAGFLFHQDVGQGLHRLAQAHVVGQDAGQVVFAQELHPGQAVGLVVAQGGLQAGRGRHFLHRAEQAELAAGFAQLFAAEPAQGGGARQFLEAARVEGRQAHLVLDLVAEIQFAQGAEDRLQAAPRQRHAQAVGQGGQHLVGFAVRGQHVRVEVARRAADQLHQHRQQRHPLLVDHDAQFQLEPGVARFGRLVDLGVPVVHRDHVVAVMFRALHVPAAAGQGVEVGFGETQPVRLALELQRAGQAVQRRRGGLAETERGQGRQRGRLVPGVARNDLGDVADLAHHALGRVERDALAVVIVGQHRHVVPALLDAVGQLDRIEQQVRTRRDVVAQALGQRLRQRHQLLQAVGQQQLRHAPLVAAGQRRSLGHQRLQLGQRDVDPAAVQFQRAARQVVDIPRGIGRQHVIDLVGRAVGGAGRRFDLPAEARGAALVAPDQVGLAHRSGLQRIHQAARHVGPRVGPQQFVLFQQHLQQDRADLALRLGRGAALRGAAAHRDEEAHQVLVVAFEVGGRGRQQREHLGDRAGGGYLAVRAQACLAQAQRNVAPAAGRGQHVHEFIVGELGILDFGGELGARMGRRVDPLQPAGHGRGKGGCWSGRLGRHSRRRGNTGFVSH